MDWGRLHLVILHFPIALALAAVFAHLMWWITTREFFRNSGLYCLWGAAIMAVPTVITGALLLNGTPFEGALADLAEDHEDAGYATLGILIGSVVIWYVWRAYRRKWLLAIYGVALAALLVAISLTGHLGGKLAFGQNYLSGTF
jgi:uncharacterized membrane protein